MLSFSLFWFFYFAGLGIFFPYYSLYLRENAALSGTQVGLVMAMLPLVGIFAQPIWGQIADRTGARTRVLTLVALGSSIGFFSLTEVRGFASLMLATAALAVFVAPVVPVSYSVGLAALRERGPDAFGRARVWGTVGFLVLVVAFPWGLDGLQAARGIAAAPGGPSEPGLEVMFPVTAALVLVSALIGLALPRRGTVSVRAARGEWRPLLRQAPMVRFLIFSLAAYFFLQGPMALFPIFVRARGGTMDTVGQMWVLMLLIEIPLVLFSGTGLRRLGARGLLAVGVAAGGLRWLICGLTSSMTALYAVQLLHGVVVTGLMLGAPLYIEELVPARLRSTGQALFSMVGVGLGGITSNTWTGWLIDVAGADAPYVVGGAGALVLGCLAPFLLAPPRPSSAGPGCPPRPGSQQERDDHEDVGVACEQPRPIT